MANGDVNRPALEEHLTTKRHRVDAPIRQFGTGHVGVLKGEFFPKNHGQGIVHRSPQPGPNQEARILVRMHF